MMDANQYGEQKAIIKLCKPLQDGQHRIHGNEVRNMVHA